MRELADKLKHLEHLLKNIQAERPKIRSTMGKTSAGTLADLTLSDPLRQLLQTLRQRLEADIYRYVDQALALPNSLQAGDPASEGLTDADSTENPPGADVSLDPALSIPSVPVLSAQVTLPNTPFTQYWTHYLEPLCQPPQPLPGLPLAESLLYALFQKELQRMNDHLGNFGSAGLGTLQKLRKAESMLQEGNVSGTLRLIKAAKAADPHNTSLAFIFSQILYFQAQQGHTGALPEARAEAAKACTVNDQEGIEALHYFRYCTLCCERAFTEKRVIELLQDYYLLDAENISGHNGWAKADALYLKSWVLLSTTNPELWGDYVFQSIHHLVQQTIGGTTLYLHLLRDKALSQLKSRAVPPPGILDVEKWLLASLGTYQSMRAAHEAGWVNGPLIPTHWTVKNRFVTDFLNTAPFPTYDEVCAYVAMNGRSYEHHAYPNFEFIEKGYGRENFWRIWAVNITAGEHPAVRSLMPVEELAAEREFYAYAGECLEAIKAAERDLIDQTTWAKIEQHMLKFTLEHLISAGNKGKQSRSHYAPTLAPFNTFHRQFNEKLVPDVLFSRLIEHAAQYGAFGEPGEILAALQGAALLLKDSNYGLEAQQKAAKKEYERYERRKQSGLDLGLDLDFSDLSPGTILLVMLPILLLTLLFSALFF